MDQVKQMSWKQATWGALKMLLVLLIVGALSIAAFLGAFVLAQHFPFSQTDVWHHSNGKTMEDAVGMAFIVWILAILDVYAIAIALVVTVSQLVKSFYRSVIRPKMKS